VSGGETQPLVISLNKKREGYGLREQQNERRRPATSGTESTTTPRPVADLDRPKNKGTSTAGMSSRRLGVGQNYAQSTQLKKMSAGRGTAGTGRNGEAPFLWPRQSLERAARLFHLRN